MHKSQRSEAERAETLRCGLYLLYEVELYSVPVLYSTEPEHGRNLIAYRYCKVPVYLCTYLPTLGTILLFTYIRI